jgi:hypothetical protein
MIYLMPMLLIIPSENEFFQHIKGYVDPRHKERSDEFIHQIGELLANKHVILMRSDRADNEELYRTRTFKDQTIGKFSIFDEMDIPGGLHGMKYHFIKENMPMRLFESGIENIISFIGVVINENSLITLNLVTKDTWYSNEFITINYHK